MDIAVREALSLGRSISFASSRAMGFKCPGKPPMQVSDVRCLSVSYDLKSKSGDIAATFHVIKATLCCHWGLKGREQR